MACTKKIINQVETCVDENLVGFCAANPLTKKLKNYRVLVRSDLNNYCKAGKIALVSGGGSGHEPMFAGFVGEGCLTASIAGSVFTSPPPTQILAALNAIKNPKGILVFIANYTGDRLNFGIAIERFNQTNENVHVKFVIMADDCALTSKDKSAGRRGLSGMVFVLKISGAMAELGFSVDDVARNAEKVVQNLGTIGLSLSSCSLPGCGPIFSLGQDEMEIGLGVHGEPGVKRVKLKSAKETVDMMMNHLTDKNSATHLPLKSGDEIAVLLNNLGGLTQLEINLLCKEILDWLENKNFIVKRFYAGSFMTSLEMQGFSLSILRLVEKDWYNYLDGKTNCSAWPKSQNLNESFKFSTTYVEDDRLKFHQDFIKRSTESQKVDAKVKNDLYKCLLSICDDLISSETYLNKLDQCCGDGDCGTTMKSGTSAIKNSLLNYELSCHEPHTCLQQLSEIWENNTGGTAGAIYSLFLSAGSKSLRNNSADFRSWLKALIDGTSTIMKYSEAEPGDRTMVDPLSVAADIAKQYLESQSASDKEFLKKLFTAVEESAKSTTNMVAKAGRASYVAKSNLIMPDPGAMAVSIWMKSIVNYYSKIV